VGGERAHGCARSPASSVTRPRSRVRRSPAAGRYLRLRRSGARRDVGGGSRAPRPRTNEWVKRARPVLHDPGCAPEPALEARILARRGGETNLRETRRPVALAREGDRALAGCFVPRFGSPFSTRRWVPMMDISHPLERRPLNEERAGSRPIGERELLCRTLLRLFFDHADRGPPGPSRDPEVDALARSFRVVGASSGGARAIDAALFEGRPRVTRRGSRGLSTGGGRPWPRTGLTSTRSGPTGCGSVRTRSPAARDDAMVLAPWTNSRRRSTASRPGAATCRREAA